MADVVLLRMGNVGRFAVVVVSVALGRLWWVALGLGGVLFELALLSLSMLGWVVGQSLSAVG